MSGGSEIVVPAVRRPKSAVRVRRGFSSGKVLVQMAARLASRVEGLEPERATEILLHLGRRRSG